MPEIINLASRIEKQLPKKLSSFIRAAGKVAQKQQQRLYLVGGVVRDLLLERHTSDIDMVVEGNAIKLAQEMADIIQGRVTPHHRFGTAKVQWDNHMVDIAMARAESYTEPGALPTVKAGTIGNDLARRDFTINAMAIELNPRHYGELLDSHNGKNDLEQRLIRVLHEKSFIDDATRIWRAIRYEQRLGFRLELATQELVKQSTAWLDTISGDRIRHELELILKEELPEKVLRRADELNVLVKLHPSLKGDTWLTDTFALARETATTDTPQPQLYLALMAYRLSADETEQLIAYLKLPKATAEILRDTAAIKNKTEELATTGLAPSLIYELLHGYSLTALTANSLATDTATAAEHIELYLNVLRHVQTSLNGGDLKRMGIPEGPKIKEVLHNLREAKLDGRVSNKKEEEEMVRGQRIK